MHQQTLIGLNPFNEFMLKSCYYHHLMACYDYYGANQKLLLSNNLTLYAKKGKRIVYKDFCLFDRRQISNISGIYDKKIAEPKALLPAITKCIQAGTPVILAVDNYYLPYRKYEYRNTHMLHYILVYGYDYEKECLVCLEHLFANSFRYQQHEIPFKTVLRAHKSAVGMHKTDRTFVAVETGKFKNRSLSEYKKNTLQFRIQQSIKAKDQLFSHISLALKAREYAELEKISTPLMGYKWKLCSRIYVADPQEKHLVELQQKTMNDIAFVASVIMKAYVSKDISDDLIDKACNRLKIAGEAEDKLHEQLLSKLS